MALSKRKRLEAETVLRDMLDPMDSDVVVVRGSECEVLFMNAPATQRLDPAFKYDGNCKESYARLFPGMCTKCPGMDERNKLGKKTRFDMKDIDSRLFETQVSTIVWLDGKPATVWTIRDVDNARRAEERLYNLAYIDQLTGAPNRQRFREDFEAARPGIEANELTGTVAIFDLDNFKNVNDSYGHNTGDIMLKRLAEHLMGDPGFKDHFYRLGGDEFVCFVADKRQPGESAQSLIERYEQLLSGALMTYTLSNIDVSCTISMGAAFFPMHGYTSSELLRKADIALYKAKNAGRNRLTVFEDRYDTAKRLRDVYINIQPVLNARGVSFGYELCDQGDKEEETQGGEVLNLTGIDRATDAMGLDDLKSKEKYFINYTRQLQNPSVLANLPKDKFIIQIKLSATVTAEQIKICQTLKNLGYSLALTNIRQSNMSNFIFDIADFCKLSNSFTDKAAQRKLISTYRRNTFIAANVNTPQQFEEAKAQGFKLFQGYYFDKPAVIKRTKEIDPMKVNYLRLLKLTSTAGYVDFQEISAIIASDVALSYKLLKLLNSAALGLRYRVSSIPMAVTYLGEESLKKWIALLALRGAASDKPAELIRVSLIRAQFAELLAPHFRPRRNAKSLFLLGMFSLLHIALDKTKVEMLEEIPVEDDIKTSLLTRVGPYSDIVDFFGHYEYANWEEVDRFSKDNLLSCQLINDSYIAAVKWYNGLEDSEYDE